MKKFPALLICLLISFVFSGYKFPEKLPNPLDIDTFTFEKVKFGQTSVNEFSYLAPNYDEPEVAGKYTIYSELDLDKNYKSLRAGFKDNFLDWVELEFAVPQSVGKFKQNYGNPKVVNKEHSSKFNYHDYGFFNVITDKNNVSAFGVTLYAESDFNPYIAQIVEKLPDYKDFNFINEYVPGQLMENDFVDKYKNLVFKSNQQNAEKIFSIPNKYFKYNEKYEKADFVFSNGILAFVNLTPKNLSVVEVKKIYGDGQISSSAKENIEFLEYPNFIITYNKATNKVLKVGIVGAL